VQAPSDLAAIGSPETYIGFERAARFKSTGGEVHDSPHVYGAPRDLGLNEWALSGSWQIAGERGVATAAPASIVYRFQARDLNLVLGSGADQAPLRFRVTLDGHAPGADHGVDVAPDGTGSVRGQRLYQLLRLHEAASEHTFSIEFLDPGVEAYSFTFG
jgi:hypothetical protein